MKKRRESVTNVVFADQQKEWVKQNLANLIKSYMPDSYQELNLFPQNGPLHLILFDNLMSSMIPIEQK